MSNEYEFIFKQFTHPTRTLNFNEWDETYGSKKEKLQFNTKFQVEYNRPSGRVTGYNIKVMDFHTNKDVIMINYQADAINDTKDELMRKWEVIREKILTQDYINDLDELIDALVYATLNGDFECKKDT